MRIFLAVLLTLEMAVALQGCFASRDVILTRRQMLSWTRTGLPFLAHGGMWGDALLISPLVAAVVAYSGGQWSWKRVAVAVLVGLAASFAMHETYQRIPWPEAHVYSRHLTEAGWVHLVYMAAVIAALLLYYFDAQYTPLMWLVSAFLVLHIAVGNHVVLGLVRPAWYPGRPLQNVQTWVTIGGTAVLTLGVTALRAFRIW